MMIKASKINALYDAKKLYKYEASTAFKPIK